MIVALDFETYYSSTYSLRRMRETDYLLSPEYQTIMCAVKEGAGPSDVFIGHNAVQARLDKIDWSRAASLSHNARFDGAIMSWHFGHTPKLYLDTLSMARAMTHATIGRSSLAAVAEYLGLGEKGHEVVQAMGKRLEDFSPNELAAYAGYCANDNELCAAIFKTFMTVFPKPELKVIDLAIRMFVEPQGLLDTSRLRAHRTVVRVNKAAIMLKVAHIDKTIFSSNLKFAALLESHGVDVPTKVSPTTGHIMPAMAKGDREFKDLCADEDQPLEVQALLAARVSAKSTLEETRTETLLGLSTRAWGVKGAAWMPVPLRYYGAHTGRFSGDGGYNFQNLGRNSPLKRAIIAPPGMVIIHRDASQIEARMAAWLAGCIKMLDAFEAGRDVYSEFGSDLYGETITKRNVLKRFIAKTAVLSLQYQAGGPRLKNALYIGNGGPSVTVTETEAIRIVHHYRSTYPEIPALWASCESLLFDMLYLRMQETGRAHLHPGLLNTGGSGRAGVVPAVTIDSGAIWLPNGMPIAYPKIERGLVHRPDGTTIGQFHYQGPYTQKSIYGGKVTENISQALSRIVITDAAVRIHVETGFHPFMTTHDSLDYLVPASEAQWWDDYLERQFAIRPSWAPRLPLASEGGWGRSLTDAEKGLNP